MPQLFCDPVSVKGTSLEKAIIASYFFWLLVTSSEALVTSSDALVTSSFLLLVLDVPMDNFCGHARYGGVAVTCSYLWGGMLSYSSESLWTTSATSQVRNMSLHGPFS